MVNDSDAPTQQLPKVVDDRPGVRSRRRKKSFREVAVDVREGALAIVCGTLAIAMVLFLGVAGKIFYEVVIK